MAEKEYSQQDIQFISTVLTRALLAVEQIQHFDTILNNTNILRRNNQFLISKQATDHQRFFKSLGTYLASTINLRHIQFLSREFDITPTDNNATPYTKMNSTKRRQYCESLTYNIESYHAVTYDKHCANQSLFIPKNFQSDTDVLIIFKLSMQPQPTVYCAGIFKKIILF